MLTFSCIHFSLNNSPCFFFFLYNADAVNDTYMYTLAYGKLIQAFMLRRISTTVTGFFSSIITAASTVVRETSLAKLRRLISGLWDFALIKHTRDDAVDFLD